MKIDQIKKSQLYYGKYEFCISWKQYFAYAIGYDLDAERLEKKIKHMWKVLDWRPTIMGNPVDRKFIKANLESTRTFLAQQREQGRDFKLMLGRDRIYVYTNDIGMAKISDLGVRNRSLPRKSAIFDVKIRQIKLQGDPGTIALENPRHRFRTYLRHCEFTAQERKALLDWTQNQKDHISVCGSMLAWLQSSQDDVIVPHAWLRSPWSRKVSKYSQPHYYVEYDDTGFELMLQLIKPRIIRRTYPVVKKT